MRQEKTKTPIGYKVTTGVFTLFFGYVLVLIGLGLIFMVWNTIKLF